MNKKQEKFVLKWVNVFEQELQNRYDCFGGGQFVFGNPVAEFLADRPAVFVTGTSVRSVVVDVCQMVLAAQEQETRAAQRRNLKRKLHARESATRRTRSV